VTTNSKMTRTTTFSASRNDVIAATYYFNVAHDKWPMPALGSVVYSAKRCPRCGVVKGENEYRRSGTHFAPYCKLCYAEYLKEARKSWSVERRQREYNTKEVWRTQHGKDKNLSSIYTRKFGISLVEYEDLFKSQKGCCAICGRPQSEYKRRFAVDHDHVTGEVRALLCCYCNQGLGHFRDSLELLEKAAGYLKDHKHD